MEREGEGEGRRRRGEREGDKRPLPEIDLTTGKEEREGEQEVLPIAIVPCHGRG